MKVYNSNTGDKITSLISYYNNLEHNNKLKEDKDFLIGILVSLERYYFSDDINNVIVNNELIIKSIASIIINYTGEKDYTDTYSNICDIIDLNAIGNKSEINNLKESIRLFLYY